MSVTDCNYLHLRSNSLQLQLLFQNNNIGGGTSGGGGVLRKEGKGSGSWGLPPLSNKTWLPRTENEKIWEVKRERSEWNQ